jgi:hypothetical protein
MVERNIVTPPNQNLMSLSQKRSAAPAAGPPDTNDPNNSLKNGDPGSSASLARSVSPVDPPNHRFNVENARMAQPPSATAPGSGAVPVAPFTPLGRPSPLNTPLRESPKR